MHNQEILILINSGSSCTFISEKAVETLQCAVTQVSPISVTLANGQKITSSKEVPDFTWWTQWHTFTHIARVLPISCYDVVLGMDWLEKYSPMWIHWKCRLLHFSHEGQSIALKGIKDALSTCPKIKIGKLKQVNI